jgi:creatinine amidohydrolase/Fe(II)-dependent formamide hydrolase-like protein
MSFPGTMTLTPETFQAVVLEVVDSLRSTAWNASS